MCLVQPASLRFPQLFVRPGDPAVRTRKASKTDHVVDAGPGENLGATQVNRSTACAEPAPTAAHSPTAATKIPPWNPIERYRSDKNSFPDYGRPGPANMNERLKKFGNAFLYGNWLNSQVPQPDPPIKTPKRVSDSALENNPKRLRTEGDVSHDIRSTPSSSGLPEKPATVGSADERGAPDTPSLRSSANRSANGQGLEEYRNTEQRVRIGKNTRQRRKDKTRRSFDGLPEDGPETCVQKTHPSASYRPRGNRLVSLRKQSDDPIQDDDDIEVIDGPVARASVINRRSNLKTAAGHSVYTTSRFTNIGDSDDELAADQSAHANIRPQRQAASVSQTTVGRKRPTSIEIDESPELPATKRRTQASNRADMRRTTFTSKNVQIGDGHGGLRVSRAVGVPSHVYPPEGGGECVLVSSTTGTSPFEAVDPVTKKPMGDLVWLTPRASKVREVTWPRNSLQVKIVRSPDETAQVKTGPVLFLEFRTAHEAERLVERFCGASRVTVTGIDLTIDTIEKEMDIKLLEVNAFNEKNAEKALDTDVQYSGHKPSSNRSNANSSAPPAVPVTPHSQQPMNRRPLWAQMRTDDPRSVEPKPEPKFSARGAPTPTPDQIKELREDFGEDSQPESQPRRIVRDDKRLQTPSQVGKTQPELRPQRNLRSVGPKPKSPSPAIERWTEKHPSWADDWRIDLVYERTVVSKSDIERLDEGQLLNDEIITFYLKYLHKQLEERDGQLAQKVYLFNSFFWEKLKPKRGGINYEGVKNWTAKVDLLSFDYIVVPINEHMHWYVAIICNAKELLSSQDASSEADESALDKIQVQEEAAVECEASEVTANDDVKKIAADVSHISIEDDPAEVVPKHWEEDSKTAAAKKSKATKRGNPRKYDPKATRVITLDSLDGAHSAVSTALKLYLQHEIESKKGLRVEAPPTIGMSARDIPTQPNLTDCGVYLLGYMREFMKDPERFATNILQREARTWGFDAPTLRKEIRGLIFKLQKDYQRGQERMRREKALAKRLQLKQQGVATKPGPSSGSYDITPFPASPAPQPGSVAHSCHATPVPTKKSLSRPAVEPDTQPAHEEQHMSQPAAGDIPINMNNVSMIVNVDESIEDTEAHSPSITPASKPVDSIELESGDDAPEPSTSRRRTHSAGNPPQNASTNKATPAPAHDERRFLPQLSSPESSPVKAGTPKRHVNRGSFYVVKSSSTHLTSGFTGKRGAPKGRVTKSEVIRSSSDEAGGSQVNKKESPTIDLTNE